MKNKKLQYIFIIFFIILFFFGLNNVFALSYTEEAYNFNFNYDYNDDLTWSVYGTLNNKTINYYTYNVFDTEEYKIIPFVREYYGNIKYCYFRVPIDSNYYAVRFIDKDSDYFYFNFFCDSDFYYNNGNGEIIINSSEKLIDNCSTYPICTIYDTDGTTIIFEPSPPDPTVVFPYIANKDINLTKGTEDYFLILPGTFTSNDIFNFDICLIENNTTTELLFETTLNSDSPYYKSVIVGDVLEFWFEIPVSDLPFSFISGKSYIFTLSGTYIEEWSISKTIDFIGLTNTDIYNALSSDINTSTDTITSTIIESNKELQSSINEQTEVQEEQLETSKGIWGTLKDVLSYINPFSENFFVYKLIDLLIDALKSLFIPDDTFLNTYFSDLLNWFSDRLGFLSYPLELIFDVLNRIININFNEPIIDIPNIYEPSTNVKIINATSYNFNTLLENKSLKTVHDIYLILVDAVIIFGLVNLLKNKLEEVFTK